MANTITRSTQGYVLFDTNEGKTAGDAYSGSASHTSGTFTYRNIARGGDANNIVVEATSNNGTDYLAFRTYTSATEMIMGQWVYLKSSASGSFIVNQLTGDTTVNDTQSHYGGFQFDANLYIANSGTVYTITHKVTAAANWYYLKFMCKTGVQKLFLYDANGILINGICIPNYTYNATMPGEPWGQIRFISSNTKINVDNWSISKTNTLTIAGLVDGMSVALLNASDAVLKTAHATGTSLTIDTTFDILPIAAKFVIYGTDGSTLLTSSVENIFGGDTWTYSGDTSTPSGNPKKIITKLNVAGGY